MCHQDNRVVSLLLLKTLAKNIDVIRVLRSRELAEAEKVKAREETEFSNYSQKKLEERAEGVYIDVRNSGPRGSRVEPMDPKRLSMMQDAAPSRKSLGEPGGDIKSLPTFMRSSHSPNKEEDGNNLQKSNPSQEDTVKISTPVLPRMYQPPRMASRQPSSMLNS